MSVGDYWHKPARTRGESLIARVQPYRKIHNVHVKSRVPSKFVVPRNVRAFSGEFLMVYVNIKLRECFRSKLSFCKIILKIDMYRIFYFNRSNFQRIRREHRENAVGWRRLAVFHGRRRFGTSPQRSGISLHESSLPQVASLKLTVQYLHRPSDFCLFSYFFL